MASDRSSPEHVSCNGEQIRLERSLGYEWDRIVSTVDSGDADACQKRRAELRAAFIADQDFRLLAERITNLQKNERPFTVVVLISHKMPRLADALGLDFSGGAGALVVSDFALPWIADRLSGANVAVVDDSINVGSTIRDVLARIEQCGAEKNMAFAIYGQKPDYDFPYELIVKKSLSEEEYRTLSSSIALRLALLNKPYELEFPILTFTYEPPPKRAGKLVASMAEHFVQAKLAAHAHPLLDGTGLHRFTLAMPGEEKRWEQQIRLYIDDTAHECRFVPMCAPDRGAALDHLPPAIREIAEGMLKRLVPGAESSFDKKPCSRGEAFDGEAKARVETFASSLAFGLRMLKEETFANFFSAPESEPVLSRRDISFLFGAPDICNEWEKLVEQTVRERFRKK